MDPNTIREFAASFQKSRILLSGFELDIFTNVDESGTTNNQIANNLHLDEHACERLLNALVSLGFLAKQNHLYFNTPESFNFLSKKSSNYLGGLMHSNHLWNTWLLKKFRHNLIIINPLFDRISWWHHNRRPLQINEL